MNESINNKIENKKIEQKIKTGKIMACIGTDNDHKIMKDINKILSNESYVDVDYFANEYELKNKKLKNAGPNTYVISEINNLNKKSDRYNNCTGIIVSGTDKISHENISFMTHQDPWQFLRGEKESYLQHLDDATSEMISRCGKDSIDAVIYGGNYPLEKHMEEYREDYLESIKILNSRLKMALGLEPEVIIGPKLGPGGDIVLYDNNNRRLYIAREEDSYTYTNDKSSSNSNYNSSKIFEKVEDWKNQIKE